MKPYLTLLATGMTILSVTAFAAKPGTEPAPTEYKYIGVSDNVVTGNSGLSALTQACRDTHGDQARIATADEIIAEGGETLQALALADPVEGAGVVKAADLQGEGAALTCGVLDLGSAEHGWTRCRVGGVLHQRAHVVMEPVAAGLYGRDSSVSDDRPQGRLVVR